MRKYFLLGALSLALAGCAGHAVVVPAVGAAAAALGASATMVNTATTVLSDGAQVACAVEKVSNDLGAALPNAAAEAAAISKYAGLACTW